MKDRDLWSETFSRVNGLDSAPHAGKPHGSIQWKGTDVCIDVRCPCGHQGHIDGEFFYSYKCVGCGAVYAVGSYVQLVPLTAQEQTVFAEHPHQDHCDDNCDTADELPDAAYQFLNGFYRWAKMLSLDDFKQLAPILQTLKGGHIKGPDVSRTS